MARQVLAVPVVEGRKFVTKHSKKALKASLTLGILLGMFFVAWLPFFVANVVQVRRMPESPSGEKLYTVTVSGKAG